ncbi:MAG: 4Fe-4S binding protein [Bryobacterales bacterium]|nr:4Fe-4S binding protein [Bryobacterales bacterium]
MACRVEPHCNACGICVAICPVNAILETVDGVRISSALCTECVGYADTPVCMEVCAIDAISDACTIEWKPRRDSAQGAV